MQGPRPLPGPGTPGTRPCGLGARRPWRATPRAGTRARTRIQTPDTTAQAG